MKVIVKQRIEDPRQEKSRGHDVNQAHQYYTTFENFQSKFTDM
jgi:hypothetical protein